MIYNSQLMIRRTAMFYSTPYSKTDDEDHRTQQNSVIIVGGCLRE